MRLAPFLALLVFACTGSSKDDSATGLTDSDADTDTDADADADADTDTDTTTEGALVSGCVVGYDGATPAEIDVQFCETTCFTTSTDANGCFEFTGMAEGSYKLDGVGEILDSADYGRIRMHVDLGADDFSLSEPLYLPRVIGPVTVTSAGNAQTVGGVTVGFDLDELTVPFGYEADQFWVGTVGAEDIPSFWGVTPAYAITFLPLATEVAAPFTLAATADLPAGDYDVYSVDDHGVLEGPVGSTTVDESGDIPNTTVSPGFLTWLLFVPK